MIFHVLFSVRQIWIYTIECMSDLLHLGHWARKMNPTSYRVIFLQFLDMCISDIFHVDDLCMGIYKTIKDGSWIGAVLWKFVKPILVGKILFTPDTPETRLIMDKVFRKCII